MTLFERLHKKEIYSYIDFLMDCKSIRSRKIMLTKDEKWTTEEIKCISECIERQKNSPQMPLYLGEPAIPQLRKHKRDLKAITYIRQNCENLEFSDNFLNKFGYATN